MTRPLVSVLIPAHNAAAYLMAALESVLTQSLRDLEVIVVDDASSDDTPTLLNACRDPRLRVLRLDRPHGIAAALNRGAALCRADLIARMDADDLALPERLSTQADHLQAHPTLAAVGSRARFFGSRHGLWRTPSDPQDVAAGLLFSCEVCHPSVMLRARALQAVGGYPEDHPVAEDYALWPRLLEQGGIANLPRVLLRYRRHAGSVSERRRGQQRASTRRIWAEQLRVLGIGAGPRQLADHALLCSVVPRQVSREERQRARAWAAHLLEYAQPSPHFTHARLQAQLTRRLRLLRTASSGLARSAGAA